MRLLILLLILLGDAGDAHANGKLVAEFKSKSGEHVSVSQEDKKYGLDLIISKHTAEPSKKKPTKRVRNAFGVVLSACPASAIELKAAHFAKHSVLERQLFLSSRPIRFPVCSLSV